MKPEENELCGNGERTAKSETEMNRSFVSSVAHELRTPVAVLRGSLEALCDGVVSEREQVEEYHRQMLAESIYLQRLVTDLLEYSRLQNSSFSIVTEPVNIPDVVSDVCRSIRHLAETKNIRLIRECESYVYAVKGDYARLRQMLIVILDNAVKFTDEGGSITVTEKTENDRLYLTVTDTGCGIDDEELEDIFVKFHRSVTGQNRNGTGLGLAIAREIAQRHAATVSVKSKKGEGSSFTFCFNEHMTNEELEAFD